MSKNKLGTNPFRPGTATSPAHLAGRGEELGVIANVLEAISGPRNEKTGLLLETGLTPVKIVGPRGVGKTTLLAETRLMAEQQDLHVVWVEALPNLEPDGSLFEDLLAGLKPKPKGRLIDFQRALKQIASLKADPMSAGLSSGEQEVLLSDALEACLEQRRLVLLLDEAMEYDPDVLGTLLQICQSLIFHHHPLALMFAGTPNLDSNLENLNRNFTDRTQDLYINDLTPEATAEALRKPFEDDGAVMDDKALKLMVKMTDNYPFFTQIVGAAVWDVLAATGRKNIDVASVREAEATIKRERQGFYKKAYRKIQRLKIMEHAHTVMDVLKLHGGRATSNTILRSLARDDSDAEQDRAMDIFDQLVDRGFIWSKEEDSMEAGIPSFFTYCQEREKKAAKEAEKAMKQKKPGKKASAKRAAKKKTKA